jgi:hypothetical protein
MDRSSDEMPLVSHGGEPDAPAAPRSVWPVVVGAISVTLAGQTLLDLALAAPFLFRSPGFREMLRNADGWTIASTSAETFLGWMLLVAGIGLLRRRSAAGLHVHYAILRIFWVLVVGCRATWTMGPFQSPIDMHWMLYGILAQALLVIVYPAFLLIWFRDPRIRPQWQAWQRKR